MLSFYTKHSAKEVPQSHASAPSVGNGWVVGSKVSRDEIDYLVDRYRLDESVLLDTLDQHELPRVEFPDGGAYLFLRTPRKVKYGEVISNPLLVVTTGDVFATLSISDYQPPLERSGSIKDFSISSNKELLSLVVASVVADYESHVRRTSRFIRDTGHRLRSHEATNRDFIQFVTVEDNLNQFKTDLGGMKAAIVRFSGNIEVGSNYVDSQSLEDIVQHIDQLLISIDSYMQSISSIRNAYSTVANNVLNQRMKVLTVITVVIALPNVIYGMYGMNVLLPFAEQPGAFVGVVVFTFILIGLLLAIAKKVKLL